MESEQDSNSPPGPTVPSKGEKPSGLAIASLVLGILAMLFSIIPVLGCMGIPLAIVGAVLGGVALMLASKSKSPTAMAGVALGLNVLSILIAVVWSSVVVHKATEAGHSSAVGGAASAGKDEPAQEISASQLVAVYDENEIRADGLYKGKVVIVRGLVQDIKKDILDEMYVTLGSGQPFREVQCYFASDAARDLANLSRGTEVKIRGRVDGLMMNVLVKECSLVK